MKSVSDWLEAYHKAWKIFLQDERWFLFIRSDSFTHLSHYHTKAELLEKWQREIMPGVGWNLFDTSEGVCESCKVSTPERIYVVYKLLKM